MSKRVPTKLEVETWLDMQISIRQTEIRAKDLNSDIYMLDMVPEKQIYVHGVKAICDIFGIAPFKTDLKYDNCKGYELSFIYNGYKIVQVVAEEIMRDGK